MKEARKKRGLSPVIATVMLIGMVVVMGLIIFTWFRGLTQEAVLKFDKNIQLSCSDVQFTVDYSGDVLSISNTGQIPIYDFKIRNVQSSGDYQTNDLSNNPSWTKGGLDTGDAFSGSYDSGGASKITLIPVLRGQKQSEGAYSSYDCSNNGQDVST